ncbi:MAG: hypothetical protein EOP07_15670 [Proteobacteria bacterium]|nr:MAG: hypothetical protein EOP07_15670 [Pseudomonadota bacterium]
MSKFVLFDLVHADGRVAPIFVNKDQVVFIEEHDRPGRCRLYLVPLTNSERRYIVVDTSLEQSAANLNA